MKYITTKEIIDKYCEEIRTLIDKPELYNYEMKIGKNLIEMDIDDLHGLVLEFKYKEKEQTEQLFNILKLIFEFYIDKIEVIENPFLSK